MLEKGIAEGRIEPSTKTLDALATAWFKAGHPAKAAASDKTRAEARAWLEELAAKQTEPKR